MAFAAAATWSGLNPKCLCNSFSGADAPNVLVVLFDDTGLAAWSPHGGRIEMPTLHKGADRGLRYTQWHTTALCSPTRSTFLTGRNHHVNRCASIMEATDGFPGAAGRLPAERATIGQVLQDNGYSTFWVGKNHHVPLEDVAGGASRSGWPLTSSASHRL